MKTWPYGVRLALGAMAALTGFASSVAAMALADRHVTSFPSVPDVVLERLPQLELRGLGEPFLLAFIGVSAVAFMGRRRNELPYLLALTGLLYVLRGMFLLLLPIGPPDSAPVLEGTSPWPFPGHSYFPSGHVAIMSLLALQATRPLSRWVSWGAVSAYAAGVCLARAHYAADVLGGLLLAYAVHSFGARHLRQLWSASPADAQPVLATAAEASVSPPRAAHAAR